MNFKYKHAILGGTFDRLHVGHKHFIEAAEKVSEHVTIGLVTDKFLGDRLHKDIIEPYGVRVQELKQYLISKKYDAKTEIHPLNDIFGPALKDPNINMVLAIDESVANAKLINRGREKRGLAELEIVVVPMIKADDGGFISSKRIRNGEIDRNGKAYLKLFTNTLHVPENLKPELRKPFGKVIISLTDYKKIRAADRMVIAVGDIVVSNFIKVGFQANISIIDLKTNRQPIMDRTILESLPMTDIKTENEPSTIERGAVRVLNSILRKSTTSNKNYTIEIEGEEDLLAIPAILLAPLGSIVLYGIRGIGGIVVEVTEEKKEDVKRIIKKI
ncbi:MAG: hypothetical protein A3C30_05320 [Candidatus Levybacteria bacterium RIFCSPHIGHO2_02_FULL_40_18]|nr:MAG: hypothetical protein A2869_02980 [Candidatus Levybacteria bacterium RIFCSPHIGHO2_01_FULL_40_58]OGH26495.1 MAG: hypothetical protein A3C30_05320 [Candidatus Levybacteria bacterium RIFCSPHIGHO2_02_FULL_40_18]OGH31943.1 MAG: hypothetical protein A3E43_01120 [Candidatus Levybacteria bacterium RIFCSPHIGHO2_12_FULL_40_31]OGH40212.1 MAG: hypothetical protein A2894_05215 [Candidatus Levybacteria bacterium RIFCSPLOWO2_01_FULL_40_64]OGH49336.1 MAG: hypothetical protein A3I54_01665 [Candidatus Lev